MSESFAHKKSLGQHFLNSEVVPRWLCDAANLEPGESILEIGPGTGALTRELLKREVSVVALEADQRAIDVLNETFHTEITNGQLEVVHSDVRTLDLATLPIVSHPYKVVANIPYYLSGMLFRTFLDTPHQPNQLVFLVQKEVARRATSELSRGEKESLLSLSIKLFGQPEYVRTVRRGHFTPPPKVDSAIIAVRNISRKNCQKVEPAIIFELLHLGFGKKRKQLLGNLAGTFERKSLEEIFTSHAINHTIRAEDIPLETWIPLIESLAPLPKLKS